MSKKDIEIATIPLHGTKDGIISISTIKEPYGAGSDPVASIGISLQSNSEEPDWKVHIPKQNIEALIEALHQAVEIL